jgi:hypothetical protein
VLVILVISRTVIDQPTPALVSRSISFQDQNPESARTVTGPDTLARRSVASSSPMKRMTPRKVPAAPLRIREAKISPVPARVAISGW